MELVNSAESVRQPPHPADHSVTFHSILFERPEDGPGVAPNAPACFADLHLDQIIAGITAGKEQYDLRPFFHAPLRSVRTIQYRHEVMQDLEDPTVLRCIRTFAQHMQSMREHVAQADKLYYQYQKQSWFLDAVHIYCDGITDLADGLASANVRSRGLAAFRDYLRRYAESGPFMSLQTEIRRLKDDLSAIRYCLVIGPASVTVRKPEGEIDYSADVSETFERFKQGTVKDYTVAFPAEVHMDHVEAKVLEFVAQLYPDVFLRLDTFCASHGRYQDDVVRDFDREIQFYVAYLEYMAQFRGAGLGVCYPRVSAEKRVYGREVYDFALAHKLVSEKSPVICNDFELRDAERVFVVSGPNQGGKTTFARTFGQLHYLGGLGCPVAGREAQTFLCDRLLTHFEQEEDITNLRGKLEDDLVRIRNILSHATPDSIIILNEIFTSTALQDAVLLSTRVMETILRLDAFCLWVTFLDELASMSQKTVSMVSTVVPENPAVRTYKILRRPADGLAYALSIAEKYRLTYDALRERIRP
jgi:DNA mismatch repair protein MutS